MKLAEDLEKTLADCFSSTKIASATLFPERFFRPFSGQHEEIFRVLDDDSIQKVVIKAPRGVGKTSIVNFSYPAKKILFREKKFIIPISNTATQAVLQAENLKQELLTNEIINKLFGNMKSEVFSKEQWITDSGTMIMPRGSGQQVRGLLFRNSRPSLILCDDLEDSESVRSEEQRKKLKQWFMADVLNSVDRGSNEWKIVVIGTLLHEDSLLQNLMDDPSWVHIDLDLCDDDYNTLWPEIVSTEDIRKMVDEYRMQGELDVFYREFRGRVVATEDAVFQSNYFKYYDETKETPFDKREIENVVIVDPAKSTKLHSAESAIVGIGIDLIKGGIYLRDLVTQKFHPDQLYAAAFNMADNLRARVIAIEVTSLNEFITYPIKNEMMRRGKLYEIVELHARSKKEDRIAALVPFYRQGLIIHNKNVCGPLEAQLLSFPNSRRSDCMDAVAYIVELMENGDRYFFPNMEKPSAVEKQRMEKVQEDDYADLVGYTDNIEDIAGDGVMRRMKGRI